MKKSANFRSKQTQNESLLSTKYKSCELQTLNILPKSGEF